MATDPMRLRAAQMLVLANACWALSFPTMKALTLLQQPLLPQSSTWFIASLTVSIRFALAALVVLLMCARTLRQIRWWEVWQGFGLGLFAGIGLIFQMDGLAYTAASTSAFLTQFYCLLIPLLVACRERRWPSLTVAVSCLMVIAGGAVLSGIDWHDARLGRGELETLLASTIFTGQILWLQRAEFARNNVNHFTLIMFAVIALVCAPVAVATGGKPGDWTTAYESTPALLFMGLLTGFCTLGGYLLMNRWQPLLSATQAGLLYCLEPVFASLLALVLPEWFSAISGIHYPNERIELSLVVGGGLITVANVLIQLQPGSHSESRIA